jgi:hypothetical protein
MIRRGGGAASMIISKDQAQSSSVPSSTTSSQIDRSLFDRKRTVNIGMKQNTFQIESRRGIDIGTRNRTEGILLNQYAGAGAVPFTSNISGLNSGHTIVSGGKSMSLQCGENSSAILSSSGLGWEFLSASYLSSNTPLNILELKSYVPASGGTPQVGFGTGLSFDVHTSGSGTSPNVETGGQIQTIATDVSSGSEDFDMVFKTMQSGSAASEAMRIVSDKSLQVKGDITAFHSSDKRLKQNIVTIQNPLEKIKEIGGYTFEWIPSKGIHSNKGDDVGVIAQEVEEIIPEIVTTRENGYKAVKYEKLVPLLIEAIKELSNKVEHLETQLESKKN